MKKIYILHFILLISMRFGFSQMTIHCSNLRVELKIENITDIPTVTANNNGTISLNFSQQYITDIFENYDIYDFIQTSPTGSEELQKYYHVYINSKGIIEDVMAQVPSITMTIFDEDFATISLPITMPIDSELISLVDGKTFDVTKYIETSDADPCFGCPLNNVPEDFNFRVNFNYDAANDVLYVESNEETSCGHSFHIGLKGGNPNGYVDIDNMLQLWESYPAITTEIDSTEPCFYLESLIFNIFDIACSPLNAAYDNTFFILDFDTETLQLSREHVFFGSYIIELSQVNLSIDENAFPNMRPYRINGNPYLQISNLENEDSVAVEIFNISGQSIYSTNRFESNTINLLGYSKGLYFIKLSTSYGQQKVFKRILN
ncbi:T9SS type A sorting domain-containing protein [Winogradskyella sp.]|uniref:T9SS type A sorting domain-containing protein n=1 Tax=Winogradskyella sp. TaxID=1883156 RepID=UPI0026195EDD|nr:T9SS type A sorting domain-containing protein [Winogradskyella sp.]